MEKNNETQQIRQCLDIVGKTEVELISVLQTNPLFSGIIRAIEHHFGMMKNILQLNSPKSGTE